jgi:hypothetical protein
MAVNREGVPHGRDLQHIAHGYEYVSDMFGRQRRPSYPTGFFRSLRTNIGVLPPASRCLFAYSLWYSNLIRRSVIFLTWKSVIK